MMRLRDRLKNRLLNDRDIFRGGKIQTRHPQPFKVRVFTSFSREDLTQNEIDTLVDNGYDAAPLYMDNCYGYKGYTKSLLKDIIEDKPTETQWSKMQIFLDLKPINITLSSNRKAFTNMFYSINRLFSVLAPFWFLKWENEHGIVGYIYSPINTDIEILQTESSGAIIEFRNEEDDYSEDVPRDCIMYRTNELYNHPSMILSGISIIQSIIARKFSRRGLNYHSEIFYTHNNTSNFWEQIRGDTLLQSMNRDIDILMSSNEKIPGINNEYNNLKNIFIDILREYTRNTGTFKDRCSKLALSYWRDGNTEHKPSKNRESMNNILDEDFSWENGPEVR